MRGGIERFFGKLKENKGKSPHVFPSKTSKLGHLREPRKAMLLVTEESGIEFRLHDLRRTFITIAESVDIPAFALKGLINHTANGDVTFGYIQLTVERLREPTQRVADKIVELVNTEVEK